MKDLKVDINADGVADKCTYFKRNLSALNTSLDVKVKDLCPTLFLPINAPN